MPRPTREDAIQKIYTFESTIDPKVSKVYSWYVGRKPFDVHVWLYEDVIHMLNGYSKDSLTVKKEPAAIFHRYSKNGKIVGVIKIAEKCLTREDIIHESFHAGIELMYHMGRHLSRKYEEDIVEASAALAAQVLDDFNDYIKENVEGNAEVVANA